MSTMNISLPDALKSFVDEQVTKRGYATSSEYVRELIRADQDLLHAGRNSSGQFFNRSIHACSFRFWKSIAACRTTSLSGGRRRERRINSAIAAI